MPSAAPKHRIGWPYIKCLGCRTLVTVEPPILRVYFEGILGNCRSCGTPLDLFQMAVARLSESNALFQHSAGSLLGGRELIAKFSIDLNARVPVDLESLGLPATAKILYLNFTPEVGDCFPLFIAPGNEPFALGATIPHKFMIYGAQPPSTAQAAPSFGQVYAYFVDAVTNDHSLNNLLLALRSFLVGDLEGSVLPSAVAVEYSISIVAATLLESAGLKSNKTRFYDLLRVVLPLICDRIDAPRIETSLIDSLIECRKLRNEIAHHGHLSQTLTRASAARWLCASMLVFRYLSLLSTGQLRKRRVDHPKLDF